MNSGSIHCESPHANCLVSIFPKLTTLAVGTSSAAFAVLGSRGLTWVEWPMVLLGLLGDNAAGKSTLGGLLTAVHLPDAGGIYSEGNPVRVGPCIARWLHLPELPRTSPCHAISALANVFFGRELTASSVGGVPGRKHVVEKTDGVIAEMRICLGSVQTFVTDLSGGQSRAIAIPPYWRPEHGSPIDWTQRGCERLDHGERGRDRK